MNVHIHNIKQWPNYNVHVHGGNLQVRLLQLGLTSATAPTCSFHDTVNNCVLNIDKLKPLFVLDGQEAFFF